MVPFKCNVALDKLGVIKSCQLKGRDACLALECSLSFAQDQHSQTGGVPKTYCEIFIKKVFTTD